MKKDAAVEKILHELGLKQPKELSSAEEELFQRAIDPEKQFLYDVEQIFSIKDTKTKD